MIMNLTPLYELKDRLSALAVAGAGLVGEDFRLRRAVEQIQPLAAVSPVFAKIYALANALFESDGKDTSIKLLNTAALLDAVLVTQGVLGISGEMRPLACKAEGKMGKQYPYSAFSPLLKALTGTGSGRYTVIYEAITNRSELLQDYRLQAALVGALSDSYQETANIVEQYLNSQGPELAPLLKAGFQPQNKTMVRRVRVMEKVAGAQENEWYLSMLEEEAVPVVRCALIEALRLDKSNLDKLLELVKTEKGNAKKSAISALAGMDAPESDEYFLKQLKKKPESLVDYLPHAVSLKICDAVGEHLLGLLETALEKKTISNEELAEWNVWLQMMPRHSSEKIFEFFKETSRNSRGLSSLTLEGKLGKTPALCMRGSLVCRDIDEAIGYIFTKVASFCADNNFYNLALQLWEESPNPVNAGAALLSGLISLPPEEAYERLGRRAEGIAKQGRTEWVLNGWGMFFQIFTHIAHENQRFFFMYPASQYSDNLRRAVALRGFDSRWCALLADNQIARTETRQQYDNCAVILLDKKDKEACRKVAAQLRRHAMEASKFESQVYVNLLASVGDRDFRGLIKAIVINSPKHYSKQYLVQLLNTSSNTPEDLAQELDGIVEHFNKQQIERISYYLTVKDIADMAKQLRAGVKPDDFVCE